VIARMAITAMEHLSKPKEALQDRASVNGY
jgi:hypothetical protein